VKEVAGAELDLEMATTDEERQNLQDSKTSKIWRALRLASKTKLSLFDKVDDGRNLERFVQPHGAGVVNIEGGEITTEGGEGDDDRQPEDPAEEERSEQAASVEPKAGLVES
jgi:THO complex subunit 1